jgi:hypothetical protein
MACLIVLLEERVIGVYNGLGLGMTPHVGVIYCVVDLYGFAVMM